MDINRFQIKVATGRFTLPVVILVCLCLWGATVQEGRDLVSMGITVLTGLLLVETNTTFSLIRTRTTMPICLYWLLTSALLFLHPYEANNWIPLAFLLAVFQLFRSYEAPQPTVPVFHAFLCIGVGSLVFPRLIYLVPLFVGSMIPFRILKLKSVLAGLIGLLTPYWFLFGYACWFERMPVFLTPLQEMIPSLPIRYDLLTMTEILSWSFTTLFGSICGIHYQQVAYKDKTRTRIYLQFLTAGFGWTTAFCLLQPGQATEWMSIQLVCTAFLGAHLFTLTRNRFSGIFFVVTFVMFVALTLYHVWMHFFSF